MSEPSAGGVSVVRLGDEVPKVEVCAGVEVRHLVGQGLMVRILDLDGGAEVPIEEPGQEHVLVATEGVLRLRRGHQEWVLEPGSAVMIRPGAGLRLAAEGGSAHCLIASTPPHAALVRDLLHLEHADHGFD